MLFSLVWFVVSDCCGFGLGYVLVVFTLWFGCLLFLLFVCLIWLVVYLFDLFVNVVVDYLVMFCSFRVYFWFSCLLFWNGFGYDLVWCLCLRFF